MTQKRFSNLPLATPLTGAEILPVIQEGESRQTTIDDIMSGAADTFALWGIETLKSYLRPEAFTEGVQITLDGDYPIAMTGVQTIDGYIYGLDDPTEYRISVYASSDIEYLVGQVTLTANGPWTLSANFGGNACVKLVRCERLSDGVTVSEWVATNNHLIRSYNIPSSDPNYNLLKKRTFIYDQATAIIAFLTNGELAVAEDMMSGMLLCQKPGAATAGLRNGQFGFGYYSLGWDPITSAIAPVDPYYRTGAEMWVAYAMLHFLKLFPGSAIAAAVQAAVITLLDAHILNTLNVTGGDYRSGAFQGGYGRYAPDYSSFDPTYVIPWVSTEHNVDAYFAYKRAADMGLTTGTGTPYATIATNLGVKLTALADGANQGFWYAAGKRAVQGIDTASTFDTAHALDCGSWYSMAARKIGDIQKANEALISCEPYRVVDEDYGDAHAYTPYLPSFGYPYATSAAWIEGTAGVVLARYGAQQYQLYVEEFLQAAKFKNEQGFPYTTKEVPAYELQPWNSATSLAWMLLAYKPDTFWYVNESDTAPVSASTLGRQLITQTTAAAMRLILAITAVGSAVATAVSTAAARTAIGISTVGSAIATAASRVLAQAAMGQLRAYRTADLTRVAVTPTADPQLVVALEISKTYLIRINAAFHQPAAGESLQWTFTHPTISAGTRRDVYYDADSGATRMFYEAGTAFTPKDAVATAVGKGFLISEVVVTTTAAGNFALSWSNESASVGLTGPTVLAGASIEAIEIG